MKVKITNGRLIDCINMLDKIPLKGMDSIYRTRFNRELSEYVDRFLEEDRKIKEEFSKKDENGNPIIKDGKYKIIDLDSFSKEINKLHSEEIIISGEGSERMLNSIKKSLEQTDVEWTGDSAYIFEYLYEALTDKDSE